MRERGNTMKVGETTKLIAKLGEVGQAIMDALERRGARLDQRTTATLYKAKDATAEAIRALAELL